jgi:hypothetical protein
MCVVVNVEGTIAGQILPFGGEKMYIQRRKEGSGMPKLTVEFNDKMNQVLDELAKSEDLPKTHVIRRAIALLKYAEDERAKGNKLVITSPDDRILKEIVG